MLFPAVFVFAVAATAQAQNISDYVEGFSRTRPILRPSADAPTATIRQLRFSNDPRGYRLYSAGDDKLVRCWTIRPAANDAGVTVEPTQSTTWPIYRAVRGVIYTLDVQSSPLGDRLAFGGVGAKTSWINLMHLDRPERAQLLLDPAVRSRDNIVNCVAFHPGGSQLAAGYERTGLVLLWTLRPEQAANQTQQIKTELSNVWQLAYNPKGDRLIVAGFRSSTGSWEVQEWETSRLTMSAKQPVSGAVTGLVWGDDNTWLAATTEGIAQRGQKSQHNLGHVRAVAPPRSGAWYFMGVYDAANDRTQVIDWDGQNGRHELTGGAFIGKDIAIDVSRDGRYLAVGGAVVDGGGMPTYAIRAWDAVSRQPLGQFPDTNRKGVFGAPIANVGIVPGEVGAGGRTAPYQIGFAWGPAAGRKLPVYQWQFNRVTREITEHTKGLGQETQTRLFFDATLGGKRVSYLANPPKKPKDPPEDPWGPLPVWADRRPDCYAIDSRQKLLALGYNDGITLCDLDKLRDANLKDKDKAIVRSFYGHDGAVTCLSFAPDGTLLLSGSKDGTICAWKISDVVDPRRRPASELGVSFGMAGKFLTVLQDPAPGSAGAEAGFHKGQNVNKVFVAGEELPPEKWLAYLNAPVPGKELGVTVVQNFEGKTRRNDILSIVSQDALWTLYPQQDRNWIVWTQEGHFDAPLDVMDRLAWHLDLNNLVAAATSQGHEGSMVLGGREFQSLFHKDKIVEDALVRLIPDKPREAIVPPTLVIGLRGNFATLTATPNGNQPISELELWLNGYRLIRRVGKDIKDVSGSANKSVEAEIPNDYLRADGNQLVAVAAIEVPDPENPKKKAQIYNRKRMRLPEAPRSGTIARKLHYVGIGVSKLDGNPSGLNALEFPGHDAVELGRQLIKNTSLTPGFFEALADFEGCRPPTEENIYQLLSDLPRHAGPNDLAVVFLAGHGVNTKKGFRFIAQDTKKDEDAMISDVRINDLLCQLPCRTMLILDTCHAEGAQIEQNLQDWPGFGLGPMILASCDSSKESFEDSRLALPGGLQGHGLFTAALLEGLLPADQRTEKRIKKELPLRDANADGNITLEEWCLYARQRTAMLSDLGISPFSRQGKDSYTPKILPSFSFLDHKSFALAGSNAVAGR